MHISNRRIKVNSGKSSDVVQRMSSMWGINGVDNISKTTQATQKKKLQEKRVLSMIRWRQELKGGGRVFFDGEGLNKQEPGLRKGRRLHERKNGLGQKRLLGSPRGGKDRNWTYAGEKVCTGEEESQRREFSQLYSKANSVTEMSNGEGHGLSEWELFRSIFGSKKKNQKNMTVGLRQKDKRPQNRKGKGSKLGRTLAPLSPHQGGRKGYKGSVG